MCKTGAIVGGGRGGGGGGGHKNEQNISTLRVMLAECILNDSEGFAIERICSLIILALSMEISDVVEEHTDFRVAVP